MEKLIICILLICQIITWRIIKNKNNRILILEKYDKIGKKITSNIKIKDLMEEVMQTVKVETQAEACSLYIIDEEKQELWFEVALGEKGDKLKQIRLKIGEGIAGWVAKEGKKLNIEDVNKDTRFKKEISKKIEFKNKAMLTMPIKFKDRVIGVIQVINKEGGGIFTQKDENFIEGISSEISIALQNAKLYKEMKDLYLHTIQALAATIDAKDPYTKGHSQRVTKYALEIGKEMNLTDNQLQELEYMAILHDIGKIGIKDSILNKESSLNDEEFEIMKTHPTIGSKILETMGSLSKIIPGVKYHHEKYDGTGYAKGLKGKEIPLEARIISVADTYDAMTTDRPYRKGLAHEVAMNEINKHSGTQFDPESVKYFNIVMDRKMVSHNEC
ncbi:GAF and HD-GYP domain-containing protein [Tepidibacter hydrothermalis]|uniref:HD-GYP domain-containing protein n=1 Tax=Tepidibacter hydrothermalis TaxID=3036126 RepID=A0ABY8EIA8_9FIRM|nr:HD-GYP domain-containing protein [Tepidibacter hydrothermalis]WFD10528.1 HD-GYP domain-containing protein [Tepidibacter hydrothermalis]